jgi:hypothetical protein
MSYVVCSNKSFVSLCNVNYKVILIGYYYTVLFLITILISYICAGVMTSNLVAEITDGSSNVREVWKLTFK